VLLVPQYLQSNKPQDQMKKTKAQLEKEFKEHNERIQAALTENANLQKRLTDKELQNKTLQRDLKTSQDNEERLKRLIQNNNQDAKERLEEVQQKHKSQTDHLSAQVKTFKQIREDLIKEKRVKLHESKKQVEELLRTRKLLEARVEELAERNENLEAKQTKTSTIEELVNVISKHKKKAKKYKRLFKDARNANFKLQQMLQN
jgi:septal ring factor EnvC (AmiA/AmiB activator)